MPKKYAVCAYEYEAQDDTELNVQENDLVQILEGPDEDGWTKVQLKKKSGFVPHSYLTVCQRAVAKFPFEGNAAEEELSFAEGEGILVISCEDEEGWWFGIADSKPGVQGSFPGTYVELDGGSAVDDDSSAALAASLNHATASTSKPSSSMSSKPSSTSSGTSESVIADYPTKVNAKAGSEHTYVIQQGSIWKPVSKEFALTISKPETIGGGLKKHTVYSVVCKTEGWSVPRRYSEFFWLRQQLNERHPCIVMPLLPKKQMTGRFDSNFIEQRRRNLERFINRVSNHPVLRAAPILSAFLSQTDNSAFSQMKKKAVKEKNKGKSFFDSITADFNLPIDSDTQIDQFDEFLSTLLSNVRKTKDLAKEVVSRRLTSSQFVTKIGATMKLLGAVGKLNASASSPGGLMLAIAAMGGSTDTVAKLFTQQSDDEAYLLQEALKEYTGIIKSFKDVLKIREHAHSTYTRALQHFNKTPEDPKAKDNLKDVQFRHSVITHVLMAEIQRFHHYRSQDFVELIQNFVQTQIDYQQRQIDAWKQTIEVVTKNNK